MNEGRKRNICIKVRLTREEYDCLCGRMAGIGITNREAYIRKMILDGIIVKLDVPEIKDMISQLRYTGNNINQIAKRLNETGRQPRLSAGFLAFWSTYAGRFSSDALRPSSASIRVRIKSLPG